ncbi:MAG TPA: acetyltransferase [Planctomycetota bacterium]|nr:acetyltransferase [Planctomycetota bacterium]
MTKLVLFGTGDIARLAHHYFATDSEHEVVAFTVDGAYVRGDTFRGLPLVAFEHVVERYPPADHAMFVALSYAQMNGLRAAKYHAARQLGYRLVSYVSSRCTNLASGPFGDNCFILEDNTIQPFVEIGNDVTLWSGNHIGHDARIGDHVFIASHVVVSGHVEIGESCFLGVNATLRNSIVIAPHTLVGAGATIMADTVEHGVYLAPRATLSARRSDEVKL